MMKKQGFTLVEILIVITIMGLGLMTVAPKLAQNTILSNSTEAFFEEIIKNHLELAKELNNQVFITGYKGSSSLLLQNGERVNIPEGEVVNAEINQEESSGLEYRIYFYTDGIFDHFKLTFTSKNTLEGFPALHKAVMK